MVDVDPALQSGMSLKKTYTAIVKKCGKDGDVESLDIDPISKQEGYEAVNTYTNFNPDPLPFGCARSDCNDKNVYFGRIIVKEELDGLSSHHAINDLKSCTSTMVNKGWEYKVKITPKDEKPFHLGKGKDYANILSSVDNVKQHWILILSYSSRFSEVVEHGMHTIINSFARKLLERETSFGDVQKNLKNRTCKNSEIYNSRDTINITKINIQFRRIFQRYEMGSQNDYRVLHRHSSHYAISKSEIYCCWNVRILNHIFCMAQRWGDKYYG